MKTRIATLLIAAVVCGISATSASAQNQFASNNNFSSFTSHDAKHDDVAKANSAKREAMKSNPAEQDVKSNDTKNQDSNKAPNSRK